jgi:hypothetical protein
VTSYSEYWPEPRLHNINYRETDACDRCVIMKRFLFMGRKDIILLTE